MCSENKEVSCRGGKIEKKGDMSVFIYFLGGDDRLNVSFREDYKIVMYECTERNVSSTEEL